MVQEKHFKVLKSPLNNPKYFCKVKKTTIIIAILFQSKLKMQ